MKYKATDTIYPVGALLSVKSSAQRYEGGVNTNAAMSRNLTFRVERISETWNGYKRTDLVVVSGDSFYEGSRYYNITNTGLIRTFQAATVEVRKVKGAL